MQGEYRGDFTRDTFDPAKHFSRVLMQQGRVQLDADWNEQTSILLHYLRTLSVDLIGAHGGPNDGFKIDKLIIGTTAVPLDFSIHGGHYYVDGILCENDADVLAYTQQAGYPFSDDTILEKGKTYLVYLDVWERHVTCVQDDRICEVALGGTDTASRAKVIWQVKKVSVNPPAAAATVDQVEALLKQSLSKSTACLRARAKYDEASTDPCLIKPAARFRGSENQLYRAEIHKRGVAWDGKRDKDGKPSGNLQEFATIKWSRDNASVIFPILTANVDTLKLANLGRDDRGGLREGDWAEVVDDNLVLQGQPGLLLQVATVKRDDMTVTLNVPKNVVLPEYKENDPNHPLLRRWDHRGKASDLQEGALLVKEGEGDDQKEWITLEDGIEIQFKPASATEVSNYRAGDYWLIPARTATGDVLWPKETDANGKVVKYDGTPNPIPAALPPNGVEHHYAPLAVISTSDPDGSVGITFRCRQIFKPPAGSEV